MTSATKLKKKATTWDRYYRRYGRTRRSITSYTIMYPTKWQEHVKRRFRQMLRVNNWDGW